MTDKTVNITQEQLAHVSQWFQSLPEQKQRDLLSHCRMRQLNAKDMLFRRGDRFDGIYVLLQGGLWISGLDISGAEIGLTVIEPGQWFGEIALFDKQDRTHDVVALKPSILLFLSANYLHVLTQEDPSWWRLFGTLLTSKMRLVFQNLEDRSLPSASVRLARRLLLFYHSSEEVEVEIAIPQQQLGQLLSLSRQKTNQLLKQFEQEQIVRLAYGKIVVLDANALHDIAFPSS